MGLNVTTCGPGNRNCLLVGPSLKVMAILVLVASLDAIAVMFAPRPLPWAVAIPSLIPLLTTLFVIIPMLKTWKP